MSIKYMNVIIRGGGDIASGIAHRLFVCGFRPVITELPIPKTVRRLVSFSSAVLNGKITVEGVTAIKESFPFLSGRDYIPVIEDSSDNPFCFNDPDVLIDARMLKNARKDRFPDAKLKIGIGPGFEAGIDVDIVVETNRGLSLGKVIRFGKAERDTKIPGVVCGKGAERVLRAPCEGKIKNYIDIGSLAEKDAVIAEVGGVPIAAPFRGRVRGLIVEGSFVFAGDKVGDIDPRENVDCFAISDKARAVGGGVLEAILSYFDFMVKA